MFSHVIKRLAESSSIQSERVKFARNPANVWIYSRDQTKCNPRKNTQKWKYQNQRYISLANRKSKFSRNTKSPKSRFLGETKSRTKIEHLQNPSNVANCIDIQNGDYRKGVLIAYPCHTGPNQKFTDSVGRSK